MEINHHDSKTPRGRIREVSVRAELVSARYDESGFQMFDPQLATDEYLIAFKNEASKLMLYGEPYCSTLLKEWEDFVRSITEDGYHNIWDEYLFDLQTRDI